MYCYECKGEFKEEDMHKSYPTQPDYCKKCHAKKRREKHLAKVAAEKVKYAEQQADRKANREAKAKADANMLLGNAGQSVKAVKPKAWQRIGKFIDDLEMNRLIKGEEL